MFDVLTIAALADELSASILDGRVQRVGHLDPRSIGIEVYAARQRRYLVASANNQVPYAFLSDQEPAFDTQLVTPFSLLLRKYARGGRIVGIEQPPLERLLRLSIAKWPGRAREAPEEDAAVGDDEDEELEDEVEPIYAHLVIEIMGRHSNLILVDDAGQILDSVKRVTPQMSRVRPILPKLPYEPPPPIDKQDPRRLTTTEAARMLAEEPPEVELATVLGRRLRAMSGQMAREIAYRVAGQTDATIGQLPPGSDAVLAREVRRLFEPLLTSDWQPRVYRDEEREVVAFSAVPMQHLAAQLQEEAVETISRAAQLAIAGTTGPMRHAQRRARLVTALQEAHQRAAARLQSLRAEQSGAAEADRLREWGELIYAYLWKINPGDTSVDADGIVIPLDPQLSPKENAQAYLERYRKAQAATRQLPELIEQAEHELAYLEQLRTLAEQAERFDEIEALEAEWAAYQADRGHAPHKEQRRTTRPRGPRPVAEINGNQIYVGRSGRENEAITFDVASPDDTWLHARGVPGSHVIVRWRPGGDEDEETIEAAASLAAYFSAARESGRVEVDVAPRRFVRKIKGAGPGMVTYRNERTIAVRPRSLEEITGQRSQASGDGR